MDHRIASLIPVVLLEVTLKAAQKPGPHFLDGVFELIGRKFRSEKGRGNVRKLVRFIKNREISLRQHPRVVSGPG